MSNFAKHLSVCRFKPNAEDADSSFNGAPIDSTSGTAASPAAAASSLTPAATTGQKATAAKVVQPKSLCKLAHPKKNDNSKVYFHSNWKHPVDKKLVKLNFLSINSSYKPYTLASYIKVSS